MTRYGFETLEPSPSSAESLAILGDALRDAPASRGRRIRASIAARSPDEGLALLNAYIAITDYRVRQAILDVVMTVSPVDPPA